MKKKLGFQSLAVGIIIISIVSYLLLQEPYPEVTLQDYYKATDYNTTNVQFSDGDELYIYFKNEPYDLIVDDDGLISFLKNYNFSPYMSFTPLSDPENRIVVHNYTEFYYPTYKGYNVVAKVEFSEDHYAYEPYNTEEDIIISSNLPVVINHLYSQYDFIPVITGVIGILIMFTTFINFGSNYHDDIYQQGYKKKQRGKQERY
ncbi:hypothetical protein KQ51_01318 [Candidatus Izimaplasma bacterium HR1]|jgi:hypothetical protein|uniref:hypothetical protein n=1 Tax=Candidatus Izimoplasma sp. HR1 TaxID=1541959 RepID=UPI0004F59269|nr:hypothetical protein KQ51_01318 [Candidatus Izimaplasma bacterium HR1]